jgi:Tfp pilus assembly protein PilF
MYVPLAALVALACVAATTLLERAVAEPRRRAAIATAIVVVLGAGYATLTYARNAEYRSPESLWQTVIDRRPQNPRGYNGVAALLDYSTQRDRALPLLLRAVALDSTYADARYNLGNVYDVAGRHDEAIAEFRAAARLDTTNWKAWNNIGKVCLEDGRPDLAYAPLARALELSPGASIVHNNMGTLLAQTGHLTEAIPHFETAVQLDPTNASAAQNLDAARAALPPRTPAR